MVEMGALDLSPLVSWPPPGTKHPESFLFKASPLSALSQTSFYLTWLGRGGGWEEAR